MVFLMSGCKISALHKHEANQHQNLCQNVGIQPSKEGKLYPLEISLIPNKEGVNLRNRILEVFQDTPIYFSCPHKLNVQLDIRNRELVRYIDGTVGRYEIMATASFEVLDVDSGNIVFKNKVYSVITYNTASSQGVFEFNLYTPYYDSMFESMAREIFEAVRVFSKQKR